eukprot:1788348-Rhodomonas_salina.1
MAAVTMTAVTMAAVTMAAVTMPAVTMNTPAGTAAVMCYALVQVHLVVLARYVVQSFDWKMSQSFDWKMSHVVRWMNGLDC